MSRPFAGQPQGPLRAAAVCGRTRAEGPRQCTALWGGPSQRRAPSRGQGVAPSLCSGLHTTPQCLTARVPRRSLWALHPRGRGSERGRVPLIIASTAPPPNRHRAEPPPLRLPRPMCKGGPHTPAGTWPKWPQVTSPLPAGLPRHARHTTKPCTKQGRGTRNLPVTDHGTGGAQGYGGR